MSYCWYFTQEDIKEGTPSRDDGITLSAEARYRRDGARFVINASNTLGLRYDTMATGVVFFHRFFMVQSFKQFDRWVVGAACLLLAGKVEETPKKCKDILKVTRSLLNDHQMAGFGSNPKEELLTHERILLQTVKFDLQLEHPYSYLLKFAKELKGEKSKIEKLVQMAWTFVNDSLCTTLCLQWEPQAIAVAFLYLAGKLTKFDLQGLSQSKSRSWWRQFVDTLDFHDLESICHQVLDIYGERESDQKKSDTAPEEVDPAAQQQTPPTNVATPTALPPGNMAQTTPTQGQLPPMHLQSHRYHTNHHSPSPVPPPAHGAMVAPPTCTAGVLHPPTAAQGVTNLSSLQPSQVTYVGQQVYALADPLQALQAMRPASATTLRQVQPQPGATANIAAPAVGVQQIAVQTTTALPYSTLNLSVGNTTSLPRAPMIHQQSFSQLPGQQQQQHVAYNQTVVGAQVLQKSLSVPATASPHQAALRTASIGSYQQLPGVGGGGGTGIQLGVLAQTGTGIGIGTGTQMIGSVRTGQPGLALTPTQQNYATPPSAKRTAYDLSGYHVSPGVVAGGAATNQTSLATQQLNKLPSLLPPSTNSLMNARVPSLMSQQSNTLYRTVQSGTPLTVAPSQLPGGGSLSVVPSQLPGGASTLSAMAQLSAGRGGSVVAGALPGQLHNVMGATGVVPVRSALPQPQPPANARPPAAAYGVQQNYGGSTGRGTGWGMR